MAASGWYDTARATSAAATYELRSLLGRLRRRWQGDLLQERVFFLHVPKCGGTSVHEAITAACWRPSAMAHVLDAVGSNRAARYADEPLMAFRERILLYLFEQQHLRYVGGHFVFDEHLFARYGQTWHFITVLRHPVERWLSQYYFNRYRAGSRDHFGVEASLETFLGSAEGQALGSDLVAKFAGRRFLASGRPPTSEKAIARATSNLLRMDLVGFTDRLDDFADAFERRFGASLQLKHANKNPADEKKQAAASSPDVLQQVKALCAPDLRVYEAARASWL